MANEDWAIIWANDFIGRYAFTWAGGNGPTEELAKLLRRAKHIGDKEYERTHAEFDKEARDGK